MATDLAALRGSRAPVARDIPHTVSPGLWTLAWRRLRSDTVGMVSLVIVAAFILMMILSGAGLIASDWNREVGVNYAPPTFLGEEATATAPASITLPGAGNAAGATQYKSNIVDPIGDVIEALKAGKTPGEAASTGTLPPPETRDISAEERSAWSDARLASSVSASRSFSSAARASPRRASNSATACTCSAV